MAAIITKDIFVKKCNIVHDFKYSYDKTLYTKMWDKIIITCPIHGDFEQFASNHKKGAGCPHCNYRKQKDTSWFINEAKKVTFKNDLVYNYDETELKGMNKKVIITCPVHGNFEQYPWNHLKGAGCKECGNNNKRNTTSIFIENSNLKHKNFYDYNLTEYSTSMKKIKITCPVHGTFLQTPNDHLQGAGCPQCCISPTSKAEKEINEYFQNIFETNSRKIISPKEIDLFSKEYKFGIEYNGNVYHSFGINKSAIFDNYHLLNKNRHLEKTIKMEEQGYQLFHIQSIHWNNPIKKEIWKSVINNKIGNSYKFFARKLKIIDLSNHKEFVKNFLNENHLQGSCGYKIAYGLCNEKNEVYSIMTFGKSRFNKNIEYELLRFCNLKNTSVIGGANKLLKHFERTHKPNSLISYANRDWSQGNLYETLGFEYSHTSKPNYFYIDMNEKIINRISAQKHKLKNLLNENFNENLSERDNMINNGYRIYYDTGNLVYHKKY